MNHTKKKRPPADKLMRAARQDGQQNGSQARMATDSATTEKTKKHARRHIQLNWPLVLVTLGLLVVLAPSAYFLREYQVSRTAGVFLERAANFEQEKDWAKAATYISNYLRLHPNDHDQEVHLAEVFGNTLAEQPQNGMTAVRLYRRAINNTDKTADQQRLRRAMVPLLIQQARFKDSQIEVLQQPRLTDPDDQGRFLLADAEDRRLLAKSLLGRFQIGAIDGPFQLDDQTGAGEKANWTLGEVFQQAVELNPDDPELVVTLAELYASHPELLPEPESKLSLDERKKKADHIVAKLVSRCPDDAQVLLASYRYRMRYHEKEKEEVAQAEKELNAALAADPDNIDVLLTAAGRAMQLGEEQIKKAAGGSSSQDAGSGGLKPVVVGARDEVPAAAAEAYKKAEAYYRRVLEKEPANETAWRMLGRCQLAMRQFDAALKTWNDGLKKLESRSVSILSDAAELSINLKRYKEADEYLDQLDRLIDPTRWSPKLRAQVRRTISFLRGRSLLAQGKPSEAIRQLLLVRSGLSDRNEDRDLAVLANALLATAYQQLQQWDLAAMAYEQIIDRQTGSAGELEARRAAADAWRRAGQFAKAADQYRIVLAARDVPEIRLALAETLLDQQAMLAPGTRSWDEFARTLGSLRPAAGSGKATVVDPWRVDVLDVRRMVLQLAAASSLKQKKALREQALTLLKDVETQGVKSLSALQAAMILYQQLDRPDDADRLLTQYATAGASATDIALVRARLQTMRGDNDAACKVLLDQLKTAGGTDRDRLQTLLAQINPTAGITSPSSSSELVKLAEAALSAKNWKAVEDCVDKLRLAEGDAGSGWRYVKARRLLGLLIQGNAKADDPRLIEAIKIQRQLESERPYWSPAFILKASLAQLQGNVTQAIEAYQKAIELGERRVAIFEQLARLMWSAGRTDVDSVLAQLGTRVANSPELSAISILSAAKQGDLSVVLGRAQAGVQNRPNDPLAHLWLGQVLLTNGNKADAEAQIQKAIALAPTDFAPRQALFAFYKQTNQLDKAREVCGQIEQHVKFETESNKEFKLAQLHEQLGDQKQAQERLVRAAEKATDSGFKVDILVNDANIALKAGDVGRAVKQLEQAYQLAPTNLQVRRSLAAALAARGTGSDFDRALQLLPDDGQLLGTDRRVDQRLRAMVLLRRADDNYPNSVAESIEILQKLVKQPPVSPGDRIQLARLYTIQSQIEPPASIAASEIEAFRKRCMANAKKQLVDLVSTDQPSADHIAQLIGFLVLSDDRPEAQRWLDPLKEAVSRGTLNEVKRRLSYVELLVQLDFQKLAGQELTQLETVMSAGRSRLDPSDISRFVRLCIDQDVPQRALSWIDQLKRIAADQFGTLTTEVQWLHASGRDADIQSLVDGFAKGYLPTLSDAPKRNGFYLGTGNLLTSIDMHKQAQKWYELLAQDVPGGFRPLAACLAQQGQWDQVVQLCQKTVTAVGIDRAASTLADVIAVSADVPDAVLKQADEFVKKALEDAPDSSVLLMAAGNLNAKQQRVVEAVSFYERVAKQRPRDAMVLNNLATLLADMPGRVEDALTDVDLAMVYSGVQASLLDTKGSVFLSSDRNKEAVRVLKYACWSTKTDPRYRFHLAVALDRVGTKAKSQGQLDESQKQLNVALRDGLEKQLLTPTDHRQLAELRKKYADAGKL